MSSLLQDLPYKEYKVAITFTLQECERFANAAGLQISFSEKSPGEQLLKTLDRNGYSYPRYKCLINTVYQESQVTNPFQPQTKIAILIANEKYHNLGPLATPVSDCQYLSSLLKELDFVVLTLMNSTSKQLRKSLQTVFEMIPEHSYCFLFYAGHGCQITNIQCMLGVECPSEDIQLSHCVTENFLLSLAEARQPELVVLIMDMCRVYLDRKINPQIYQEISTVDGYHIYQNLIISYTAQPSESAYEIIQIECSSSGELDTGSTFELKTSDLHKIVPGSSQYVKILSVNLTAKMDINSIIDRVNAELEKCPKKQRPIKVQCGSDKRSLHDPAIGDVDSLKENISQFLEKQLSAPTCDVDSLKENISQFLEKQLSAPTCNCE